MVQQKWLGLVFYNYHSTGTGNSSLNCCHAWFDPLCKNIRCYLSKCLFWNKSCLVWVVSRSMASQECQRQIEGRTHGACTIAERWVKVKVVPIAMNSTRVFRVGVEIANSLSCVRLVTVTQRAVTFIGMFSVRTNCYRAKGRDNYLGRLQHLLRSLSSHIIL